MTFNQSSQAMLSLLIVIFGCSEVRDHTPVDNATNSKGIVDVSPPERPPTKPPVRAAHILGTWKLVREEIDGEAVEVSTDYFNFLENNRVDVNDTNQCYYLFDTTRDDLRLIVTWSEPHDDGWGTCRFDGNTFYWEGTRRLFPPLPHLEASAKKHARVVEVLRRTELAEARAEMEAAVRSLPDSPGLLDSLKQTIGDDEDLRRAAQTAIEYVDVSGKGITDDGLGYLAGHTTVRYVDASRTSIGNAGLLHLVDAPRLMSVKVWDTQVNDNGVKEFRQKRPDVEIDFVAEVDHETVARLWAFAQKLTTNEQGRISEILAERSVTDDDLLMLVHLPQLTHLYLYSTNVTDAGLRQIARLPSLESLSLSETKIEGTGLHHLAVLTHLTTLDLSETPVENDNLAYLKALTGLRELKLGGIRITDDGTKHIAAIPNLRTVNLYRTALTNRGLEELLKSTSLRSLWLSDTRIDDDGLQMIAQNERIHFISVSECPITAAGLQKLRSQRRNNLIVMYEE